MSGLPCPHAISCILFKTNSLENYVAYCYTVEHFKQTYAHCLIPVEGMNSWPVSEREPLNAPGYVKMPGRPKTERRREVHEPKKTLPKCQRLGLSSHAQSARVLVITDQPVRREISKDHLPLLLHKVLVQSQTWWQCCQVRNKVKQAQRGRQLHLFTFLKLVVP